MPENDARLALVHNWLSKDLGIRPERIEPASSDASFRRYFRAFRNGETFVIMDAPPGKEDVRPYVKVTGLLESLGVHVPHILESDVANGLLLLEDLGVTQYLQRLEAGVCEILAHRHIIGGFLVRTQGVRDGDDA